jgi:hypothetical protein
MIKNACLSLLSVLLLQACSCADKPSNTAAATNATQSKPVTLTSSKNMLPMETVNEKPMTCKLTTPELMKRKTTVLAGIKTIIIEKKELINGFSYKFDGTDATINLLTDFIKTERQCCDFFNFSLAVNNDQTAWLNITGAKGVKTFIKTELEL